MKYEYKESIKEMIESYVISESEELKMKAELDQVYAQATKADEYEAKAEAFDAIMREWEDERMTKSHILETIQKYYDEYESGDHNV